MVGGCFLLAENPIYRKSKRYAKVKNKTIDDVRNIVIKIKQLEGVSTNTIHGYEKVFNDFDRFFGEKTDIKSLTQEDARNFIYWQLNEKVQFLNHKYRKNKPKGVSINSANTYLDFSISIFNVLVNEKIVEENIFNGIKHIKDKEKKIETLTPEEIKKIIRSLDKRVYSELRAYIIIHVCLDSFGRINEILSLKKEDVDLDSQVVTFSNTKSGKVRMVPISKKTVKLIEEMIEENEEFESEYIFLTNHGKPLKPDTFRKHFREVIRRSGINKRVHPHLLRHSASAMFLKQNGNIRVLQKILGHSDLIVTSRYAHVLDDTIRQQHELFSPLQLIEDVQIRKTRTKRTRK